MPRIIPVLHNTSSVQRLLDFARLVLALGLKEIVVTKTYGAAAQHGLGELGRLVYKGGGSLLVLPDLPDAVELLSPDTTLIVSRSAGSEPFDPMNPPRLSGRILVAFNGGDPDFSSNELSLGKPIYPLNTRSRLGPAAEAALVLYPLLRSVRDFGEER
jgi:SpoU rRNA methylase family enzyme